MKDIDKIFSDKLYNHKTPPPEGLWDQLDDALDESSKKKWAFIYWRVAAAVILLLIAGGLWFVNTDEAPEKLANETKTRPYKNEQPAVTEPDMQQEPTQSALTFDKVPEAQHQPVVDANGDTDIALPKASQSSPEVGNQVVKQAPEEETPSRRGQLTEADPLKPYAEEDESKDSRVLLDLPETMPVQGLATLETSSEVTDAKTSVTIIYKPGAKAGLSANNTGTNKSLNLLADFKNNSISLSKIRNAKSDLLAKVFNRIDQDILR